MTTKVSSERLTTTYLAWWCSDVADWRSRSFHWSVNLKKSWAVIRMKNRAIMKKFGHTQAPQTAFLIKMGFKHCLSCTMIVSWVSNTIGFSFRLSPCLRLSAVIILRSFDGRSALQSADHSTCSRVLAPVFLPYVAPPQSSTSFRVKIQSFETFSSEWLNVNNIVWMYMRERERERVFSRFRFFLDAELELRGPNSSLQEFG